MFMNDKYRNTFASQCICTKEKEGKGEKRRKGRDIVKKCNKCRRSKENINLEDIYKLLHIEC